MYGKIYIITMVYTIVYRKYSDHTNIEFKLSLEISISGSPKPKKWLSENVCTFVAILYFEKNQLTLLAQETAPTVLIKCLLKVGLGVLYD